VIVASVHGDLFSTLGIAPSLGSGSGPGEIAHGDALVF
jgi:hypothetical protein